MSMTSETLRKVLVAGAAAAALSNREAQRCKAAADNRRRRWLMLRHSDVALSATEKRELAKLDQEFSNEA